jgi:hypothetical protein
MWDEAEELLKVLTGNEAASTHLEIAKFSASHFVV